MSALIQPFQPGQEAAVLDLILPIQQIEFGVPITAADQPDLARMPVDTVFYTLKLPHEPAR